MTFTDFDNITFKEKVTLSHQKTNRTSALEKALADKLKIEIPINKISATYNKDNKVNKLVTVFASELTEEPF